MAINYQKVGWDTTKYFNPTNMNHMDDGIKAACDKADENEASIADVNSKLGNTDISAIGDGTVTGGLNALNSNLARFDKVVINQNTYTTLTSGEFTAEADGYVSITSLAKGAYAYIYIKTNIKYFLPSWDDFVTKLTK